MASFEALIKYKLSASAGVRPLEIKNMNILLFQHRPNGMFLQPVNLNLQYMWIFISIFVVRESYIWKTHGKIRSLYSTVISCVEFVQLWWALKLCLFDGVAQSNFNSQKSVFANCFAQHRRINIILMLITVGQTLHTISQCYIKNEFSHEFA